MVPTIGMRWISPFLHVKYNFYIIPKVQFTLQKTLLMSTLFKICKIRNICCDTHAISITSGLCSLTMVVKTMLCYVKVCSDTILLHFKWPILVVSARLSRFPPKNV